MTPRQFSSILGCFLALVACSPRGLAFREDKRLTIISPKDRETVRIPFKLAWAITDFNISPPNGDTSGKVGYFAIFVDRDPMPPEENLRYLAKDDEVCMRTRGCPDEAWLANQRVFTTDQTSFEVAGLTDTRPRERPEARDKHDITIVLLDGKSRRIGETAFFVEFFIDRSL